MTERRIRPYAWLTLTLVVLLCRVFWRLEFHIRVGGRRYGIVSQFHGWRPGTSFISVAPQDLTSVAAPPYDEAGPAAVRAAFSR